MIAGDLERVAARLIAGELDVITLEDGRARAEAPPPSAILSGAFNPLHRGHTTLAEAAARRVGLPLAFELPLLNADKGALPPAEVARRAAQFAGLTLCLSRAALFTQKAALYPGSAFVLGYDTAVRVLNPAYYGGRAALDAAMTTIAAAGCRFVVGGRLVEGRFHSLADLALPAEWADQFVDLSEAEFREDISSTVLRERSAA